MAVRPFHLLETWDADYVFVHREILPLGPPVLEWVLTKVFRKKMIYDFDDAIWTTDNTHESRLMRWLRWRRKVASVCRWSYRVSCGNAYLGAFAARHNKRVTTMPTTIDTDRLHHPGRYPVRKQPDTVVIGWTGSHSTLKYLAALAPVLRRILDAYPQTVLMVIADREPAMQLPRQLFMPWSKETEIKDLMLADIGIMPLPQDEWSLGKCGFKALQYMALEIATVASPVGVNRDIIRHGTNGLLCETEEEWYAALERLILDQENRSRLGQAARKTVVERYSVAANVRTFLALFE